MKDRGQRPGCSHQAVDKASVISGEHGQRIEFNVIPQTWYPHAPALVGLPVLT